jgi:predicted SnoaL-like aldol condensation-catalyzing enzyme
LSEANKNTVRAIFEKFWNRADWSLAETFFHPDHVGHIAHLPARLQGVESIQHFAALLHALHPDLAFSVEDQIAEGDRVATRWTARSSHFEAGTVVTGISIHRLAEGRVAETWDNWDAIGLLQDSGPAVFEKIGLSL